MIKLVLTDMDDTLLPRGQARVSERAIAAIRDLRALGVRFGPATGRDTSELALMFGDADDCRATGIVANGKRIYVDGELRRHTLLDNGALAQVAELLEDHPSSFLTVCAFDDAGGAQRYWCVGASSEAVSWFEDYIGFTGVLVDEVPGFATIAATIACSGPQEELDGILARVSRAVPCFDYVQPTGHWCDILPAGLNKGTALPLLLDEMGLRPEDVLFFGDADNDVTLLLALENSVAVANATPAARAAARWHIGASADDAVAAALERLAQSIREGKPFSL